jgi:hypothetical protein
MQIRVWAVALLIGVGACAAVGQAPAQDKPQPMPAGQMGGMNMGQGMDMCKCKCKGMGMGNGMDMGQGKTMDMDKGQAKSMDMSQDKGKGMDMSQGMAMDHDKNKPPIPAGPLKMSFGDKTAEWTAGKLAALPHMTIAVFNEHAKACQTYTGVPLMDLLKPLGVPDKPHGKDLRLYLVAEGSDGYEAVYAVAEANPDVHDGAVIVADTMDGKGLADSGPLQLMSTDEKRPARWVRNLVAIRVLTAQ